MSERPDQGRRDALRYGRDLGWKYPGARRRGAPCPCEHTSPRTWRPWCGSAGHRSSRAFAIEDGTVMTAEETTRTFGWRVYGLGVMALALVCLAWGSLDP